jgi:predicted ferric reductase
VNDLVEARGARRPPADPAPVALALALTGAATVAAWWWHCSPPETGLADWLVDEGRIAGLLAGYGCVLLVVLMARVPLLERRVGSDRTARWHAALGRLTLAALAAHITLAVAGRGARAGLGPLAESAALFARYPTLPRTVGAAAALLLVGVVSARPVRRALRYETWYHAHLLTYPAVALAFLHEVGDGTDLRWSAPARTTCLALHAAAAALAGWYRVAVPVRGNLRHRMRVAGTVQEAPGVVSVLVTGERLDAWAAQPGQFFRWRFLAPGLWWASTPYSLSAPPRPDLLRITVRAVGGHSAALAALRPGTRVWAEGPYGALTAARRTRRKVLLVAGGIGVGPLRALFETLPAGPGDLTLLYRARSERDLALRAELEAIAAARGARLRCSADPPDGPLPITAAGLLAEVPELAEHAMDVYICGPPAMTGAVYEALREAGVPSRCVHRESYVL